MADVNTLTGRCRDCGRPHETCRRTACGSALPQDTDWAGAERIAPPIEQRPPGVAPLLPDEACDVCGEWPDEINPCECEPLDGGVKRRI